MEQALVSHAFSGRVFLKDDICNTCVLKPTLHGSHWPLDTCALKPTLHGSHWALDTCALKPTLHGSHWPCWPAPPNCFYFAATQVLGPFCARFPASLLLLYLSVLKICLFVVSQHYMSWHMSRSQNSLSVPFLHHVRSQAPSQGARLSSKYLYPLSHHTGPRLSFPCYCTSRQ